MVDIEARKRRYRPPANSLAGLYLNPRRNPIAVVVATVVAGAVGYQAYVVAVTGSPAVGIAVLGAGYAAYRLARVFWFYQNESIATELAGRDLEANAPTGERESDPRSGR